MERTLSLLQGPWRAEADARIARHRHGACAISVTTAAGAPIAGAAIAVEQLRGPLPIGTCINDWIHAPEGDGPRYRDAVRSAFDALVCENAMKWYAVEAKDGELDWRGADAACQFALDAGLPLRGHCLFWSKRKFVQPWVQGLSAAQLHARAHAHLERVVARYRGRLCCWDGVNELLDGDYYGERLGDDANAALYRHAGALDAATPLFVNEYSILDNDERVGRYLDLIARLRAQGAPIGGIGVQEHAAERTVSDEQTARDEEALPERQGRGPIIPAAMWARLDRLAATGLPIHLTEISFRTADEQRKADQLEALVLMALAHPAVEHLLLWGFHPRGHWLGRLAALVDDDWTTLPAFERLLALRRRWITPATTLTTDAAGRATFTGWHGVYALRLGGRRQLATFDARRNAIALIA